MPNCIEDDYLFPSNLEFSSEELEEPLQLLPATVPQTINQRVLQKPNDPSTARSLNLQFEAASPCLYHPGFEIALRNPEERNQEKALELAHAAFDLLSTFLKSLSMSNYHDKYVLELVEVMGIWRLRIRVHALSWCRFANPKREDIKAYLQNLKHLYFQETDYVFTTKRSDSISHERPLICPSCGLKLFGNLFVPCFEHNVDFLVEAKKELVRSVKILPHPTEVLHYSNMGIVKCSAFWKHIFDTIQVFETQCNGAFPLDSFISLNYGSFESGNSSDCHAHAHVSLTLEAVQRLEKKYHVLHHAYTHPQYGYWQDDIRDLNVFLLQK